MIRIVLREQACRGCRLCASVCPTDVLVFDDAAEKCRVGVEADCIGCLSCAYVCPAHAIVHEDVPLVKNFYRDLELCERLQRYL